MDRTTAPDILLRITERRRQRIAEGGGADAAGWAEGAPRTPSDNAFLGHLRARRRDPAIIAEVKMGSPRLGSLHGRVDPMAQARALRRQRRGGAVGGGRARLLPRRLRPARRLPRGLGAAGDRQGLHRRSRPAHLGARRRGRRHPADRRPLRGRRRWRAMPASPAGSGWCRWSRPTTRRTSPSSAASPGRWSASTTATCAPSTSISRIRSRCSPVCPAEAVKVAESGIRDALDVALLAESGFDAFLIGETLLLADDPAAALRGLLIGAESDVRCPFHVSSQDEGVRRHRSGQRAAAVEMGADYLGLNFYAGSPRFVTDGAGPGDRRGGGRPGAAGGRVRQRAQPPRSAAIVERVGLDLVQLSGDEGPECRGPVRRPGDQGLPHRRAARRRGAGGLERGLGGADRRAPRATLYGGTGAAWDYGARPPGGACRAGGCSWPAASGRTTPAARSRRPGPMRSTSARGWSPPPGSRIWSCCGGSFRR